MPNSGRDPTLESAVRVRYDFIQILVPSERTRIAVRSVDKTGEAGHAVAVGSDPEPLPTLMAALQLLMREMKRMADRMARLQESSLPKHTPAEKQPLSQKQTVLACATKL